VRTRWFSLAACVAAPAFAQGAAPGVPVVVAPVQLPGLRNWTLGVAVAPLYAPVWQGSRDHALSIFPDLRLNYRDVVFASLPDGLGWNIVNRDGWKLGPLVKPRFGRSENTGGSPFVLTGKSDALRGFGNIGFAAEPGAFAQFGFAGGKARVRAEVRHGFGGHDALVSDLILGWSDRFGTPGPGQWFWSVSGRATFGGRSYLQTYFGVSPAQAAATGLPAFRASSGLVSTGLAASLTRPLGRTGKRGIVTLFGGYERLADAAADSPLIRERGDRNQLSVGLSYGYRFSWD